MNRSPTAIVLMVLGGIVLLLPGACAVFFINAFGWPTSNDGGLILLWLACLVVSGFGIAMIVKAFL